MRRKLDPTQKRLRKVIEDFRRKQFPSDPEKMKGLMADEKVFLLFARIAYFIDEDNENEQHVVEAFKACDLDHQDPRDHRALLSLMAWVLFGPAEAVSTGRPKEWTGERYCELLVSVDAKKLANPRLSEKRICDLIAADRGSPVYFQKPGSTGLRKALQRARSPKHNEFMSMFIAVAHHRARYERRHLTQDEISEEAFMSQLRCLKERGQYPFSHLSQV